MTDDSSFGTATPHTDSALARDLDAMLKLLSKGGSWTGEQENDAIDVPHVSDLLNVLLRTVNNALSNSQLNLYANLFPHGGEPNFSIQTKDIDSFRSFAKQVIDTGASISRHLSQIKSETLLLQQICAVQFGQDFNIAPMSARGGPSASRPQETSWAPPPSRNIITSAALAGTLGHASSAIARQDSPPRPAADNRRLSGEPERWASETGGARAATPMPATPPPSAVSSVAQIRSGTELVSSPLRHQLVPLCAKSDSELEAELKRLGIMTGRLFKKGPHRFVPVGEGGRWSLVFPHKTRLVTGVFSLEVLFNLDGGAGSQFDVERLPVFGAGTEDFPLRDDLIDKGTARRIA